MNKSTRLLAAAALVAFAGSLGGCSSKPAPKTVTGPAHNSAPGGMDGATVVRGQTLTVRLPTLSGSEYAWRLAPASADDRMVSLQKRQPEQSETGMGETTNGAPAWDVFTFRANRPGQTTVDFIYDRPWDNGEPVRTYTLQLEVLKKGSASTSATQQASVTVE
jgi:predicted secreted protein